MKKLTYLTVGQFAKLNNINKRTLHYYDEIDLLHPEVIGENGYRYYTYLQSIDLEMILIMRKLGLCIDDIKEYKKYKNPEHLAQLFNEQIDLIDEKMLTLLHTKKFLEEKLDEIERIDEIKDNTIEVVQLEEEKILISEKIKDDTDDEFFKLMANFVALIKNENDIYNNFGSRIPVENIYSGKFLTYDRFFARTEKDSKNIKSEIKPAGKYIRAFCKGNWNRIIDMYKMIMQYASENNLTLEGYCYEDGVNEMTSQNLNDYMTQITIKIKE